MNSHHIFIDSTEHVNPSNISYNLSGIRNIKKIVVRAYEIPNSYYIVNSSNNVLDFVDSSNNLYSVTVPPGNYDAYDFTVQLNTLIGATLANTKAIYNENNYKISFSNSVTQINVLSSSSISGIIGLTADSGLINDFTCQNICNLQSNYIYLKTNLFNDGLKKSYINEVFKNYIRIQNNANMGNYIVMHDNEELIKFDYSDRQNFTEITFQLLDLNEAEIDLNGLGFSLELIVYN